MVNQKSSHTHIARICAAMKKGLIVLRAQQSNDKSETVTLTPPPLRRTKAYALRYFIAIEHKLARTDLGHVPPLDIFHFTPTYPIQLGVFFCIIANIFESMHLRSEYVGVYV